MADVGAETPIRAWVLDLLSIKFAFIGIFSR